MLVCIYILFDFQRENRATLTAQWKCQKSHEVWSTDWILWSMLCAEEEAFPFSKAFSPFTLQPSTVFPFSILIACLLGNNREEPSETLLSNANPPPPPHTPLLNSVRCSSVYIPAEANCSNQKPERKNCSNALICTLAVEGKIIII